MNTVRLSGRQQEQWSCRKQPSQNNPKPGSIIHSVLTPKSDSTPHPHINRSPVASTLQSISSPTSSKTRLGNQGRQFVAEEHMELVLVLELGASDMPSFCHCACPINSHLKASNEFFETNSEVEQEIETNDLPPRLAQHSGTRLPNGNHMEEEATLPTFHSVTEGQRKELSQEKRDRAYRIISEGLAAFPALVLSSSSQHLGADSDNEWNSASDVTAKLHEGLVKALDPFSNPEYEISDDNDSQSEYSDAPRLTPTSSDEEESEGLGSLHDLTPEENLIFLQMGDIMYNLLEKADRPFDAPLSPLFTAWRQFEMAMFASDTGR